MADLCHPFLESWRDLGVLVRAKCSRLNKVLTLSYVERHRRIPTASAVVRLLRRTESVSELATGRRDARVQAHHLHELAGVIVSRDGDLSIGRLRLLRRPRLGPLAA